MTISTQCPKCHRKLAAPEQALGKSVKCPQCANPFVVKPVSAASAPTPARAPAPSSASPAPADRGGDNDLDFSHAAETTTPSSAPRRRRRSIVSKMAAPVLLLLALAGSGLAVWYFLLREPVADWKEFASNDGGFRVILPANPSHKEQTDPKLVMISKIHEVSATPSSARFSVEYYDLPDKPINDYLYFSWLKHHLLEKGGKLARENDITAAGHRCREMVFDLPNEQMLVRRIYLAETRVFLLSAEYPSTPIAPAEAKKFFDSFKITSIPKVVPPSTAVALLGPKDAPAPTLPNVKKDPPQLEPAPQKDLEPAPRPKVEPAPKKDVFIKVDPPAKKDPGEAPKTDPAPKKESEATAKSDPQAKKDPAPATKAEPLPKKEPDSIPKVDAKIKKDPEAKDDPAKPVDPKFALDAPERALIDVLNKFRKDQKVKALQPSLALCEAARGDAEAALQKKVSADRKFDYLSVFRLGIPIQGTVPPEQILSSLIMTKAFRTQLLDDELHYIGVGFRAANEMGYYQIIICGGKRD